MANGKYAQILRELADSLETPPSCGVVIAEPITTTENDNNLQERIEKIEKIEKRRKRTKTQRVMQYHQLINDVKELKAKVDNLENIAKKCNNKCCIT